MLNFSLKNSKNIITTSYDCDDPVIIEINCISRKKIPGLYGYLGVLNRDGQTIWASDSMDVQPNSLDALPIGHHLITITIPPRSLAHGEYVLSLGFASSQATNGVHVDMPMEVASFRLQDLTSLRGDLRLGYFSTLLPWQTEKKQ